MESSLYLLKQLRNSQIVSEMKLACYILDNTNHVISMSITELALNAGTSAAAIVRLCKKLNLKGFPELRIAMAKEIYSKRYRQDPDSQVSPHYNGESTVSDIVTNMLGVVTSAINNIDKLVSRKNIEVVVNKIRESRSVLIAGTGASGNAGRDFHQKLTRLGYLSIYNEDSELQTIGACTLTDKDVVMAISYSGGKKTLIRTIQEAKKKNAYIVAITRFKETSIAKLADTVLYVPDAESLYREGASVSRICQLVIIDIIFSSLIASDFENSVKLLDETWRSIDHEITD
jgi:DNA-binding MurR/RpiR family transcriptional regulator